jgi:hypothetical protein
MSLRRSVAQRQLLGRDPEGVILELVKILA